MPPVSRKRRADSDLESDFSDEDDFRPEELQAVLRKHGKLPFNDNVDNEDDDNDNDDFDDDNDDDIDADDDGVELAVPSTVRQYKNKRDPSKPFICNHAGLATKLAEIQLPSQWPWVESLAVTVPAAMNIPDVDDDLQREAEFYRATAQSVKVAMSMLDDAGVKYVRPADYFAEMLKPDTHMARVKDALIREKSRMSAVALRKKQQESRKFSKQTQVAKIQQKHAEKRAHMDSLKQQRRQTAASPTSRSEHSTVAGVDDAISANKAFDHDKQARKGAKRRAKDAKYGFGGKKKRVKTNDFDSAKDMTGFRASKNRAPFAGMSRDKPGKGKPGAKPGGGRPGAKPAGGNRPGKARRQAQRTGGRQ